MTRFCVKCPGKKKKRALYGPECGKPTYCSNHKEIEFIDVVNKRCKYLTCEKYRVYGDPGGRPTRCAEHKLKDMINVMNKRCEHPTCEKRPVFGSRGQPATHCADHKADNMIDVKNKRCVHSSCEKSPVFGIRGQPATHCADHKSNNMIDVASKKCEYPTCETRPSFGIIWHQPTHCADHKADTMVDVINHQCAECARVHVERKGDLCAPCDVKINGASRIMHKKERNMIAALQYILELPRDVRIHSVKYDESIGRVYGSYRPDILIDCGAFFIIIECDEHQHRPRFIRSVRRKIDADGNEIHVTEGRTVTKYDESFEMKRMIGIRSACGKPCYIIRFNPDPFKINESTVNVSVDERYAALCDQVKFALSIPPSSDLVVTYMYYDNVDALLRTEIVTLPPTGCV